jgi:hypothetical protein
MTEARAAQHAHQAVARAIASGRLVRPAFCGECGKPPRAHWRPWIYAHHDDYSKPLDVRWLCSSCHKLHHVSLRRASGTYTKPGLKRHATASGARAGVG